MSNNIEGKVAVDAQEFIKRLKVWRGLASDSHHPVGQKEPNGWRPEPVRESPTRS